MLKVGGILLIALSVTAFADSTPWSDAGVQRPSYQTVVRWENKLIKTYPGLVKIIDYGTSVNGLPLRLLFVRKPVVLGTRLTLIMSGSTHGNEYLNIEDRLPEEILKRAEGEGPVARFLNDGGAFIFIPILNPDGFVAGVRENANGVDLNRDWTIREAHYTGLREPETRVLSEKLEELRKTEHLQYSISVDYHCCAGALLYPWSFKNAPAIPAEKLAAFKALGALAVKNLPVEFGSTGNILGYYPVGTTKDYYYTHFHTLAFTYEGTYKKEPQNLARHVAWWEAMVDYLETGATKTTVARNTAPKSKVIVTPAD